MTARSIPFLVGGALALSLTACGGDGDGSADSDRAATAVTSITLTFEGPRGSRAFTLRCEPTGGTWPLAANACRELVGPVGGEALKPIGFETRDRVPITETPLTVTGTVNGARVNLEIPAIGSSTRRGRLGVLRAALGHAAFEKAASSVR